MKAYRIFIISIIVASLTACNSPLSPSATNISATVAPSSQAASTEIAPTSVSLMPSEHLIGIRVVNGVGEFYNRTTGNKFVPRGMNYVRLAQQIKPDGSTTFGHALFDPGRYDSSRINRDLQKMHADGYNVIRVFLSPDTIEAADGGLSPAYITNITDFLTHAKKNQIYVLFTQDWIPGGKYGSILSADCCLTFTLMNANYLPPAGLKANQVFYQDFISALLALNAPTEYIYSYQIRNEMFYDRNEPPLSFNSGIVNTANGKSYDMSKESDKEIMVEENLVYWIDEMRTAILEIDPTALVSVGFFQPQEPNPTRIGDQRLAMTEPAIWQSTADFIDLHPYAGFELNLKQYVENYGINGMQEKPIIMGEFGSDIDRYPSIQHAAQAFVDWQIESCQYGFDGWLFWTWDSAEQPGMFNALMGDGIINGVLAPINRDDPCSP
jgi:hypothetical protein